MQKENMLASLLGLSKGYDIVQKIIGGYKFKQEYMEKISPLLINKRVVDIGCGTGYWTKLTPPCDYLGIDLNRNYINTARLNSPEHCRFICGDCTAVMNRQEPHSFDVAIAAGMFHHLNTDQCNDLLTSIKQVLSTKGLLLCFEPVWFDQQSWFARSIMKRDRGANILNKRQWNSLFSPFFQVDIQVIDGLLRIPYTLALIECRA